MTAPTICKDVAELSIYYPLVTYCGWGGVELDMTCVVNGQILSREEGALVLQSLNRIYLSEPSEELFVLIDKHTPRSQTGVFPGFLTRKKP